MKDRLERILEVAVILGALATIPLTIYQERGDATAFVLS